MELVVFASADGLWQVTSVLDDGRHYYRVRCDGVVHTETPLLAEVHDVLALEGFDPAHLHGRPGPAAPA